MAISRGPGVLKNCTAEVLLPRLAASHRAQPFATHGRADGEAAEVGAGMSGGIFRT